MRTIAASELLALWERAAACHPLDRSVLFCAWARPEVPTDDIADLPLGEISESLLGLIATWFGESIDAHVVCPHCRERLALRLPARDLVAAARAPAVREVWAGGLRLRLPSLRDLAAVARSATPEEGARRLLARCALDADLSTLDELRLREVEDALEAADPAADFAFSVECAACGTPGVAQLDAGELLWGEIDAHARSLLLEIDALARAYGWNEREILALSAQRRSSYLTMVAS